MQCCKVLVQLLTAELCIHSCLPSSEVFVKESSSAGHRVVVVSSGAIGVGCLRLGLHTRPGELPKKQALAAAGQVFALVVRKPSK